MQKGPSCLALHQGLRIQSEKTRIRIQIVKKITKKPRIWFPLIFCWSKLLTLFNLMKKKKHIEKLWWLQRCDPNPDVWTGSRSVEKHRSVQNTRIRNFNRTSHCLKGISLLSLLCRVFNAYGVLRLYSDNYIFVLVRQKLPQIYTVIAYIWIMKAAWFALKICGNIWNT